MSIANWQCSSANTVPLLPGRRFPDRLYVSDAEADMSAAIHEHGSLAR